MKDKTLKKGKHQHTISCKQDTQYLAGWLSAMSQFRPALDPAPLKENSHGHQKSVGSAEKKNDIDMDMRNRNGNGHGHRHKHQIFLLSYTIKWLCPVKSKIWNKPCSWWSSCCYIPRSHSQSSQRTQRLLNLNQLLTCFLQSSGHFSLISLTSHLPSLELLLKKKHLLSLPQERRFELFKRRTVLLHGQMFSTHLTGLSPPIQRFVDLGLRDRRKQSNHSQSRYWDGRCRIQQSQRCCRIGPRSTGRHRCRKHSFVRRCTWFEMRCLVLKNGHKKSRHQNMAKS